MHGDLFILRGLPGSGKSSIAELLSEKGKYPVYSIDDYFTDSSGNYEFHFKENHLAYKQCEDRVLKAMTEGIEKVFLDNVFSFDWEMQPYFKLAERFQYRVHVMTVENRHGSKNIHRISEDEVKKIAGKFEVRL